MSIVLRPATVEDAPLVPRLRRIVSPYLVVTASGVRHWWKVAAPAQHLYVLVAEVDGEAVGVGWTQFNTWTSEEGVASIFVVVHPDHQRSGLGTVLYEALETHVRERGGRRLQAWAVDAP